MPRNATDQRKPFSATDANGTVMQFDVNNHLPEFTTWVGITGWLDRFNVPDRTSPYLSAQKDDEPRG